MADVGTGVRGNASPDADRGSFMSEPQELVEAIETVTANPINMGLWDQIEDLADQLDDPDSVAAAYSSVLHQDLSADNALELGQRAAHFHEEWFGDDPGGLESLLSRVLELNPKSEWAFQQLTVVLTVAEKWDDVLALYERILEATKQRARKIQILEEAYQVAKDLANRPDRAIDFLKAKLELEPSKKQLEALERLLERHDRWSDLIDLWRDRLESLSGEERTDVLTQIAGHHFDKLGDSNQALETLREFLTEGTPNQTAIELLERITTHESLEPDLRSSALGLVREVYEADGRIRDIVRVLEEVLPLLDDDRRKDLHSELGERLAGLDEHTAALDHYAALLLLDPISGATQRALRREAQVTDKFDQYASALAAAADACSDPTRRVALLSDAALTRLDTDNESGAIELLLSAINTEGIKNSDVLFVGKRLNVLLERTERSHERLTVLERLASAETVDSSKRALVGDVAVLAEELQETDRALIAWRQRIEVDPGDLRALEALIELLDREERWQELVDTLGARTEQAVPDNQKRSDLIRIAGIHEEKLEQNEQALSTWLRIKGEYGASPDVVSALSRLMRELSQWADLAELLEASNDKQIEYLADQLASLGGAYRESLGDDTKAIECYRKALAVELRHEGARAGLKELLEQEDTRNIAAEALVHSLRSSGDLIGLLDIVEARLAGSDDPRRHTEILREAADIAESTANDMGAALKHVTHLFPMTPRDRVLEDRMVRLAKDQGQWDACLEAYQGAQDALADDNHAVTQMRFRQAELRENEVHDNEGALSCCLQVISAQPDNHQAVAATIRLAGPAERFEDMCRAALNYACKHDAIPEDLFSSIEAFVDQADGGWYQLCTALSTQVPESGLHARHQAELQARIARWQLEHLEDAAAATQTLLLSVALDSNRVDTHRSLAELQRQQRDFALYTTLRRLCEIDSENIQHFSDAADLAIEVLDTEQQRESLNDLKSRAVAAWRGTAPAESEKPPSEIVGWVIEKLVESFIGSDEAQRALDLLIDGARLPFDDLTSRQMRNRAAGIASEVLGDPNSAIDMYRAVLAQAPDDAGAFAALSSLYEQQGRLPELLGLRRQELAVVQDPDRALELRLELGSIIDEIDRNGGRLELLRKNLEDSPGHPASVDAVSKFLSEIGQWDSLTELLSQQASVLEGINEVPRSAELWTQVAQLAEAHGEGLDKAVAALRKVANLAPTLEALDSLARLYTERSQSAAAVPWLEQALGFADDTTKPRLVKRLAEAHLSASHREDAVACLAAATANPEDPQLELRTMLATLYREAAQWQELADCLTASLPHLAQDQVADLAQDAANIYHEKLKTPAAAVPALEKALALIPDDQKLRLMMGRSQRAAGNSEAARTILEGLITEFGRRRSKNRAAVHVELALVCRAEGDLDTAMSQLDLASKMDVGNAHILRNLADLAREQGNFDQAERSLRALLLIVRRQPPGEDKHAVGESEVLFELYQIAARDDEEKASELLESVREAAAGSDAEALRLHRTLVERKELELCSEILRARIELSEDSESKAGLLGHLADLLQGPLDHPIEALKTRLLALPLRPEDEALHEAARVLAADLQQMPMYLECLEELITAQRREEEAPMAGSLYMRAGKIAEVELNDLAKAREHYTGAEECSDSPSDALFSLARVCGAQGDKDEQARALDALTNIALADGPADAQADALYRLAELQVEHEDLVGRSLELLRKAIEIEPRYRQAALILKAAAETSNDDSDVLAQYEAAARQSGDKSLLLDFLERRAQGEASVEQIREAVDLATELDESERAIKLLERAVDSARESGAFSEAVWAVMALAHHYGETGQLSPAKDLAFEVAYVASSDDLQALCLSLATKAQESDEFGLAAELLEFLQQRDPNLREIWSPLLSVYRSLGDGDRLIALVDSTLPTLMDVGERNQLRIEKAQALVDSDRDDEAIHVLREACLDDPDCIKAASLLETVLRKEGNEEALSEFLWQRFNDAKERGNAETVTDVANRLGGLLDRIGQSSHEVFRQALEVAPQSVELLQAVLERLGDDFDPEEQAMLTERLLAEADEEGAAALALSLADMREALEDSEGVERALAIGQGKSPTDDQLRQRLEAWYRASEQWALLAQMKLTEANALEDPESKVRLLKEAASLHQEYLHDLNTCANLLGDALALVPDSADLVAQLGAVLAASGQMERAIEVIGSSMEHISGPETLPLLLTRSDLSRNVGNLASAITDLENALEFDQDLVEPMLLSVLEDHRVATRTAEDLEGERTATMRLIELFDARSNEESAREMLLAWIERDNRDSAALQRLRDMDNAAERWAGVVSACSYLVEIETGDEQILNALLLADAANAVGEPDKGRIGLERVHQAQPESGDIRDRLRTLYADTEAHRELAGLLLTDAAWTDDLDERYEKFRHAADLFVNQLGDAAAAVEPAQKARELRPDDHATIVLVADVLVASQQIEEAIAMLEPAIASHKRRSPELAALQYRMAKVSAATGDQENQLAWLKKAFDVDRKNGDIASELAHLATELQDYDLALKPLRAITLMDSPGPVSRVMALLWEAKIEHARGNRAKAELWAKKALREDPEYAEASEFLAQISE